MWIIGRTRLSAQPGHPPTDFAPGLPRYDAIAGENHDDSEKRRCEAAGLSGDRRTPGWHDLAPRQPQAASRDLAHAGQGGALLRRPPPQAAQQQLLPKASAEALAPLRATADLPRCGLQARRDLPGQSGLGPPFL